MNLTLRVIILLSALLVILGVVAKINHWIDGYFIFDLGILGLAVVNIGNFIVKEKRKQPKKSSR